MGFIFSKIYNLLFAPNHYKILMLGLDSSGKTTILNKIKNKESVKTIGIGFHVEILFYMKLIKIVSWDLGCWASGVKKLYEYYYPNTDGIIFIIDSHDKDRLMMQLNVFKISLKQMNLKIALY